MDRIRFDPRTGPGNGGLDLDQLLHPARAFNHPNDIVSDPDLTLNEKRAILSSWASDACAVDSEPNLRQRPGAARPVTFDEILDALKVLDGSDPLAEPHALRRQLRKRRFARMSIPRGRFRGGDEGSQLGA